MEQITKKVPKRTNPTALLNSDSPYKIVLTFGDMFVFFKITLTEIESVVEIRVTVFERSGMIHLFFNP